MRPPPDPTPPRGFSLLEVLVALTILALATVVLGSSYLNVLNGYETVSRGLLVDEDFAFARRLLLAEPDREKAVQGGEFESTGGRRIRWSAEIEPSSIADVFQVAFSCEMTGSAAADNQRRTQRFMLLRPTWVTDIAERDRLRQETRTRILETQTRRAR